MMRDSFSRDMDGLLRGGGNFWRTMLRYAAALASLDGSRWFTNTHTRYEFRSYGNLPRPASIHVRPVNALRTQNQQVPARIRNPGACVRAFCILTLTTRFVHAVCRRNRYSVYVTRGTSYEEAIAAGTYWWSLNLQHQKPGREWTMFGWLEPKEKKDPCAEAMAAYLRLEECR